MKILVVMNCKPEGGGLCGAVEELVKSLRGEGFYVDIVSTQGRIRDRIKSILNIFKITPQYNFILAAGCANYGFLPILIGVITARIYRKKVLVDFHEGYPKAFMSHFGFIIKLFLGDIPVTIASPYLLDIFRGHKFNANLIPYHFHYEDFPQRTKPFSWNKKFIWIGSFQFMYDPETALKACEGVLKKRNDVEFNFFGTGPLLGNLLKKYKHPNIVFHGFIPRRELLSRYQEYSVLINSSFGDNFPLRLVEAAYYELLVISARCCGTATIYDDKECLFFEKGDYQRLTELILSVVENPHLYDSFRENMHKKVIGFSWDKVKEKWLNLIKPDISDN